MSPGSGLARRPRTGSDIFPDEASVNRLVGAILLEQNNEWQLQHRYMTLETMAGRIDEQPATLTHIAA